MVILELLNVREGCVLFTVYSFVQTEFLFFSEISDFLFVRVWEIFSLAIFLFISNNRFANFCFPSPTNVLLKFIISVSAERYTHTSRSIFLH